MASSDLSLRVLLELKDKALAPLMGWTSERWAEAESNMRAIGLIA